MVTTRYPLRSNERPKGSDSYWTKFSDRSQSKPVWESPQVVMKSKRLREMRDSAGRELHPARCSKCGLDCQVPFVPDPNRPVYCKPCHREIRAKKAA